MIEGMERESADRAEQAGNLAGQLAQVQADLVKLTTEVLESQEWVGEGIRSPEHWLQVYTGLSRAQATQLVRIAERSDDLPRVREMMAQGRITADQAGLIARYAPGWAEQRVINVAELTTVGQLQRVLSEYSFARTPGGHEKPPTPPHEKSSELSLHTSGGRFHLKFETDAAAGALLEQAVREAKDALFTAGNAKATLADGLVEVASRSLASITSVSRRDHYKVLIHLDTRGQGWLNKKGALPDELVKAYTCDATVRPVWETGGVPVSVGRSQRIVPNRTRKLVEDRDRGCRYPGCPVTGFLENHHLVPWSEGGRTDFDSLISLCPYHHDQHHKGAFTIEGSPAGPDGLVFSAEIGHRIGRHIPVIPIQMPVRPPPERPVGPRGEAIDAFSIHFGFPPDPEPPEQAHQGPAEQPGPSRARR